MLAAHMGGARAQDLGGARPQDLSGQRADNAYAAFNFCSAPTVPKCIDKAKSKAEKKRCEDDVKSYVGVVFQYRACLEAEIERAVLESNDALDRWRCRTSSPDCRKRPAPEAR